MYLYARTVSPSKKVYVGKTVCLKNRFRQYRSQDKNSTGPAIYNALRKYGWNNFLKVILEVLNDDVGNAFMSEREMYWIKYHESFGPQGYNCTRGGEGKLGAVISSETRAKIGAASKKKWCSAAYRSKMHTLETRAKMSAALKGRIISQETRAKMRARAKSRAKMKPVIATEKKTGIKRKFESTYDAARTLATETGKKFNRGHVSNCANKRPNYNSHHGWTFEFVT